VLLAIGHFTWDRTDPIYGLSECFILAIGLGQLYAIPWSLGESHFGSLSVRFSYQNYVFSHVACPAHFICLEMITLKISGKEHKL
jgi:hypothetical protein